MMPVRQPIRWVHRNPDDDVERAAQDLLRAARVETAGEAPAAARERMWFELASELEPRPVRRLLVPAVATAGVLALAAVVLLVARPATVVEARVVALAGSVRVEKAGRWQPARPHQVLPLPAIVKVAAGASTSIELPRQMKVAVVGPASLALGEDAYALESGQSISSVTPGHGHFAVELGRYRVVVRGTEFWSAREGAEAAVCLVRGAVDILEDDVLVARLAPDQGWRSSDAAPGFPAEMRCSDGDANPRSPHPAPVAVTAAAEASAETAAPLPSPALPSVHGGDASQRGAEGVSTSGAAVSREPATPEPVGSGSTAALGTVGARPTDDAGPLESPHRGPAMLPLPERAPTAEVAPTPAPAPPEPTPQPRRAVDRCREAPDRERCYREVADGADLTAQSALYRLGELRRDRGDRHGALDAWIEYRSRFGAGAFAEEADLAILEMRLRLGSPLARAAADRFLRLWPQSPYLAEVRGIRGLLRHRSGDHEGALADYSEALGARVSAARRDEALYGRAACLDALGRAADARAAYERYLQDLPQGRFAAQARAALERAPAP